MTEHVKWSNPNVGPIDFFARGNCMKFLSLMGLFVFLGMFTVSCGENPPSGQEYKPNIPNVLSFSEDLVVEPMVLGEGVSDVTVESSAFIDRVVSKTTDQLFNISANGKRGIKVEDITLDLSLCGLTPEKEAEVISEVVVTLVTAAGSKVKDISLSNLEGDGAVYVDASGLVVKDEDDEKVQMTLDVLNPACSSVSAQMTYKLSDEDVLTEEVLKEIERGLEEDDLLDDEGNEIPIEKYMDAIVLNDLSTGVEELTYTTDIVETSSVVDTESYDKRSIIMFGFESGANSFFKMLLMKPSLGNCDLKPAEQTAAEDGLRFNLIAGSGLARTFLAADILSEGIQYEGIDYSAYPKAYVEIDNIPASCESVVSRVSHWLGATDMSPEVVRTCSLKEDASSDAVTWSPDLTSFVITDSAGGLITDARNLCSSVGVLNDSALGSNVELIEKDDDGEIFDHIKEGDITKYTYDLNLGGEVISEISCTGSGKLNFIHDHRKLDCSDKLMDVDAIAGVTSTDDEVIEEPVTEDGEE